MSILTVKQVFDFAASANEMQHPDTAGYDQHLFEQHRGEPGNTTGLDITVSRDPETGSIIIAFGGLQPTTAEDRAAVYAIAATPRRWHAAVDSLVRQRFAQLPRP